MAKTLTFDRFWKYRIMVSEDLEKIDNLEDFISVQEEIKQAIQMSIDAKKEKLEKKNGEN